MLRHFVLPEDSTGEEDELEQVFAQKKEVKVMPSSDQNEINELTNCMVNQLSPKKIYLFGSFAEGKQNPDSDYDFYIVMDDSHRDKDMIDLTASAYKSIRFKQTRSVDIIVNTEEHFDKKKDKPSLENEVARKGVLLYG